MDLFFNFFAGLADRPLFGLLIGLSSAMLPARLLVGLPAAASSLDAFFAGLAGLADRALEGLLEGALLVTLPARLLDGLPAALPALPLALEPLRDGAGESCSSVEGTTCP